MNTFKEACKMYVQKSINKVALCYHDDRRIIIPKTTNTFSRVQFSDCIRFGLHILIMSLNFGANDHPIGINRYDIMLYKRHRDFQIFSLYSSEYF